MAYRSTCILVAGAAWLLRSAPATQAMEVDCAACDFCRGHPDLAADLDARFSKHFQAGRTPEQIAAAEGGTSILRPPIVAWAESHPAAVQPDRTRIKYRGSILPDNSILSAYAPSVLIHGICVGTDKLAHFIQQGWEYFRISVIEGHGDAMAERYGEWLEGRLARSEYAAEEAYFLTLPSGKSVGYGGFGRTISGVISHADLAANQAGLSFFKDLAAGHHRSITNYVSKDWCEERNPNEYTEAMARIVRKNGRE